MGLIKMAPSSGYALRKTFETTPISHYSSSPGSIYPALRSLTRLELIRQDEVSRGAPYHLTEAGWRTLSDWLAQLVDRARFGKEIEHHLMRFALLELLEKPDCTRIFLSDFLEAAEAHAGNLSAFLGSDMGRSLSIHGKLSVEHGLAVTEASAAWARRALGKFIAQEKS